MKKIHEEISKVASEYKTATSDQDSLTGFLFTIPATDISF